MNSILNTVRAKIRPGFRAARPQGRLRLPRTLLSVAAFVVAGVVLVVAAVLYPGFKTAEVELNDGGVWVVSKSKNAVGRLNYPSRVLDGAV
ncbi:hypothetical protein, partial [Arthrobacter sp. Soil763]|uniref:hypothetical protein n=1 Tax=Arthrobacter sp. Soil763 TaxID=1736402 RepID=UPI001F209795